MTLLQTINVAFLINVAKFQFHCKVFEDNNNCVSLATKQKFSPRAKHNALKYHHFRKYVQDNIVEILSIDTP